MKIVVMFPIAVVCAIYYKISEEIEWKIARHRETVELRKALKKYQIK